LNEVVQGGLKFKDKVPYILRDMGVDKRIFMPPPANPEYDLVYCGSLKGRPGLFDELHRLAQMGLKILVVGDVEGEFLHAFRKKSNVVFSGRVSREDLPEIYRQARAGLNYTP